VIDESARNPGVPTPPIGRNPAAARLLAWVALALVFWLDALTPLGIADPVLYVTAVLLFLPAGHWWEPLVVAVAATILTIGGTFISHPGDTWSAATWNRPLALFAVWITAALVAQHRRTLARWHAQLETDRLQREQSRARLEEIRYALDQAAIVAATDQRGIITYVNDKFCEISRYSREELLGQDHRIINSGYHPQEFIRNLWRTIAQGKIWRGELRNRAKDGSIYWVDTTIVPFLKADGKPWQYLAIRSDITARKAAEAQLADQAALAQLGQLAAVVAHEVRNPLAGVRGTLQILRGRLAGDAPDRRIIDAMIERLDAMNAKVEDLLRFSRPRTPSISPVDLRTIVDDVVRSALAAVNGDAVEVNVVGSGIAGMADAEMLRAVLLNLVLNACQAAAGKPVEISIEADAQDARITIADRGSGIPEEHLDRVFDAFFTTKQSGTGLGLAIVKRLTELQNGRVVLQRREGGGTVAELCLPVTHVRQPGDARHIHVAGHVQDSGRTQIGGTS
jgi:PAS domain S-box-containing protein